HGVLDGNSSKELAQSARPCPVHVHFEFNGQCSTAHQCVQLGLRSSIIRAGGLSKAAGATQHREEQGYAASNEHHPSHICIRYTIARIMRLLMPVLWQEHGLKHKW